jgi:hypothetical protein
MPHFVKFDGNPHHVAPPAIKRRDQLISVGTSIRVGFKDTQSWIDVRANNPSVRITKRAAVESVTNGIAWYEIVGLYEGSTEITAVDTNTNYVWDQFTLDINGKAKTTNRPIIRGMTYNYYIDTKGIGPDYNASVVLEWKVALIPIDAGHVKDTDGTAFVASKWSTRAFDGKVESAIGDSHDGANQIQDPHWDKGASDEWESLIPTICVNVSLRQSKPAIPVKKLPNCTA